MSPAGQAAEAVPAADSAFESWDQRLEHIGRIAPFALLAVSLGLGLASGPAGKAWFTVVLAVLAAAWMTWWLVLPRWRLRQPLMVIYLLSVIAFAALLLTRSLWFAFFGFTPALLGLRLFRGFWRYVGVFAAATLIASAQAGGLKWADPGSYAIIAVLALLQGAMYTGFGVMGEKGDEQNKKRKQMIGELAAANRRLEETLAEKAGLQAQLLAQAREAGIAAERQRMAREIHDTLAQGLAGIITQLQAAQQAAGQQGEGRRHVETAARLARDSLAEARRSVTAMRPRLLEDARLPDALAEVAARWSAISEVKTEMATTGEARPLLPEIEVTLLRAAQEALANVGKHADASRVALTLSYMEDVVTLDVRDDGRGFCPAGRAPGGQDGPAPGGQDGPASGGRDGRASGGRDGRASGGHDGFGLTAMRQRLGNVAGTLAIESEPGGGTAICASVPAIQTADG